MKRGKIDIADAARMIWIATAAVFLGVGVGVVWWPASQNIAQLKGQAQHLYEQAEENQTDVRHAAQLRAVAKRVVQDVQALSGETSSSAVMATTIKLLGAESSRFKIDVQSIVPEPSSGSQTPMPDRSLASEALEGMPIELGLHGSFRQLLALISDLPRHDVLIDVQDVDLLADDDSNSPLLNAKLHAIVYRYYDVAKTEVQNVSGNR
jgi:Tfp pilus assembly protein PilO